MPEPGGSPGPGAPLAPGRPEAPSRIHSKGVRWTLEYALGADPADSSFVTVAQGTGPVSGKLGTIDLTKVPESFYAKAPGDTLQPDGAEQYTLSIRIRVLDPIDAR